MEQDRSTCPGCGAPTHEVATCRYCGWNSEHAVDPSAESPAEDHPLEATSTHEGDLQEQVQEADLDPAAEAEPPAPNTLRELMAQEGDSEHLLDQVPENMRAVLAARLKAAEGDDADGFGENTAATLQQQGYVIGEDARGARFVAGAGSSSDLSPSDMVKMAAELDGGVKPQTTLPICEECQAASPAGSENCQWCGQPFDSS